MHFTTPWKGGDTIRSKIGTCTNNLRQFAAGVTPSCHGGRVRVVNSWCHPRGRRWIWKIQSDPVGTRNANSGLNTSVPMTMMVLPKFCPGCAHPFPLRVGLCGERQLQAIALQAMRSGVELPCRHCGILFVVGRSVPICANQRSGAEFRKPNGKVGSRIGTR